MRYSAPLFVLLVLTAPTVASAQGDSLATGSPSSTAAQMAALARLRPGNTIRVHVVGQGWVSGDLTRNYPDSLVLSSDEHERVFPTAFMDSVLVRHGNAGIGAGLGGLVGMLIGARAKGCSQGADFNTQINCGLDHLMAGFAVGALLGAIIGEATPTWEHRVPVEEPRDASSPVAVP